MKITNKHNAPQTLVALASRDDYRKDADFSVTEIISPPRIQVLRRRHIADIETDVSDMLWQLVGTALHNAAEKSGAKNHMLEERLKIEIDGATLSGAIDVQQMTDEGVVIFDYKFTSVYSVRNPKPEWEAQQNIYAWLVHEVKGMDVAAIKICALLRDWNRRDTVKEGYPQSPVVMIDLPMWEFKRTEEYVRGRLSLHKTSKVFGEWGEDLPFCTDEERWARPTTYAVKREGRKTAIRVFETKEEAETLAEKEKGYVEVRAGEYVRCTGNYCGVSQWCSQNRSQDSSGNEGGGVCPEGR